MTLLYLSHTGQEAEEEEEEELDGFNQPSFWDCDEGNDDQQEPKLADLSANHHMYQKGNYHLMEENQNK